MSDSLREAIILRLKGNDDGCVVLDPESHRREPVGVSTGVYTVSRGRFGVFTSLVSLKW